jgi:hypothetical protein
VIGWSLFECLREDFNSILLALSHSQNPLEEKVRGEGPLSHPMGFEGERTQRICNRYLLTVAHNEMRICLCFDFDAEHLHKVLF